MGEAFEVAVLVGSLRKDSWSRKTARTLIDLQPASLRSTIIEIGDLPLYNEDLEREPPASWSRLREAIGQADAVLLVTPEYNRSMPGCLKNALDVGSRPEGKNVFAGRAAGVASVTPYKLGAFGANHALRQSLVYLDMPVMQQPELYVGGIAEMFGPNGALESDEGRKLFRTFMEKLADFVAAASRGAAARSFEAFLKRREVAAAAYVEGDAGPLGQMLPREGPATFLSPRGDTVQGAAAVAARYERDATSFERGGSNRLEILQSAAAGDVAWWTGYQIAEARLAGKPGAVPMKLRVTEAFRFHRTGWKLVHRHAEPAKAADK
jgi:NAD(P)H-dependent FMN reductase/ketosteroid isomerase-like protein